MKYKQGIILGRGGVSPTLTTGYGRAYVRACFFMGLPLYRIDYEI